MKKTMIRRTGFTLIEMLLVISIIITLAAMTMGSLNAARNYASAQRTRATIEKLNNIIMKKYASYQYRRVNIGDTDESDKKDTDSVAKKRLLAIRFLMRMEMPDRTSDFMPDMITTTADEDHLDLPLEEIRPACTDYYYSKYMKKTAVSEHVSAELLYLIVSSDPDNMAMFSDREIADTDGNGLLEFVDGWGHPIKYILWPRYFFAVESDYAADSDLQITTNTSSPQFVHDPFDVANLYLDQPALYPLIYSAGPDGFYDICPGWGEAAPDDSGNPVHNPCTVCQKIEYEDPRKLIGMGKPENEDEADSVPRCYDNIHNHSLNNN